jgi:hypothetical protein
MRQKDRETAPRRAVGRSSLLLLVGVMLGMITMHSTPAMSMTGMESGRASTASAATVGFSSPPAMSSETPAVMSAALTVVRDTAPEGPSPDHMLQPCLSDSTRSFHTSLSPSVVNMSEQRGRTLAVTSPADSQARSHPPSLHELCISRT